MKKWAISRIRQTTFSLFLSAVAIALNFTAVTPVKAQAMPVEPGGKVTTSNHQVAVIKLILSVQSGKVDRMTLHSVNVINSVGPERLFPKEGEWLVELKGADGVAFSINNPVTEMKLDKGKQHPGRESKANNLVEGRFKWTLFIPLHYKNELLSVREIIITDKATKRPLVKATLPPQADGTNKPVS